MAVIMTDEKLRALRWLIALLNGICSQNGRSKQLKKAVRWCMKGRKNG